MRPHSHLAMLIWCAVVLLSAEGEAFQILPSSDLRRFPPESSSYPNIVFPHFQSRIFSMFLHSSCIFSAVSLRLVSRWLSSLTWSQMVQNDFWFSQVFCENQARASRGPCSLAPLGCLTCTARFTYRSSANTKTRERVFLYRPDARNMVRLDPPAFQDRGWFWVRSLVCPVSSRSDLPIQLWSVDYEGSGVSSPHCRRILKISGCISEGSESCKIRCLEFRNWSIRIFEPEFLEQLISPDEGSRIFFENPGGDRNYKEENTVSLKPQKDFRRIRIFPSRLSRVRIFEIASFELTFWKRKANEFLVWSPLKS